MITIAVTGGIATGKTTICYLIKQIGIKTINSDNVIIGSVGHGTNWPGIANKNTATGSGYALIQDNNGQTLVNSNTGQNLRFRQGNSD